MSFTRSLRSNDTCPPDPMIEGYFESLPRVNRFVPRLLRIQRSRSYSETLGLRASAISILKLKIQLFPGVRDLLTSVSSQINDSRLFSSSRFAYVKFQFPPSSRSSELLTRTLLASTVPICSDSPGVSSLKLDFL